VQVEHGITELTHGGIDIVEAQLRLQVPALQAGAGNDPDSLMARLAASVVTGHCIEVRYGLSQAHTAGGRSAVCIAPQWGTA
jgi:urea carboxylase